MACDALELRLKTLLKQYRSRPSGSTLISGETRSLLAVARHLFHHSSRISHRSSRLALLAALHLSPSVPLHVVRRSGRAPGPRSLAWPCLPWHSASPLRREHEGAFAARSLHFSALLSVVRVAVAVSWSGRAPPTLVSERRRMRAVDRDNRERAFGGSIARGWSDPEDLREIRRLRSRSGIKRGSRAGGGQTDRVIEVFVTNQGCNQRSETSPRDERQGPHQSNRHAIGDFARGLP